MTESKWKAVAEKLGFQSPSERTANVLQSSYLEDFLPFEKW